MYLYLYKNILDLYGIYIYIKIYTNMSYLYRIQETTVYLPESGLQTSCEKKKTGIGCDV